MVRIEVTPAGEDDQKLTFRVEVRSGDGSETQHDVTVARADWLRLGAGFDTPERFIRACFEFLLEREPREAILGSFDVSVIGRYFPDFEGEITRRTAGGPTA
jgi:hypothetical protein